MTASDHRLPAPLKDLLHRRGHPYTTLVADLLNMAGGFIRSMERLNDGEKYKPPVLAMALGGPFQVMVQAQIALDEWMRLFIEQRASAVHREATAFL